MTKTQEKSKEYAVTFGLPLCGASQYVTFVGSLREARRETARLAMAARRLRGTGIVDDRFPDCAIRVGPNEHCLYCSCHRVAVRPARAGDKVSQAEQYAWFATMTGEAVDKWWAEPRNG